MRRPILLLILAAGALAPAAGVQAQPAQPGNAGVGIRLTEAPVNRRDDPRALIYVVDHVAAGTTIQRKIEVQNSTNQAVRLQLYPGGGEIKQGSFVAFAGHEGNDLTGWTSVNPTSADLPAGGKQAATIVIQVPASATPGERYGVVWAEPPASAPGSSGVAVVNRVGIRIYLSVGSGSEPVSDFAIDSIRPGRSPEGNPVVSAIVHNTGERALDMSGELRLEKGPGGLSAGPFPARLGTTLAIGATEPVELALDKQVPPGPWEASLKLKSGRVEREAKATITFPEAPGAAGEPVKAKAVEGGSGRVRLVIGAVVVLAALGLLFFLRSNRRQHRPRVEPVPQ